MIAPGAVLTEPSAAGRRTVGADGSIVCDGALGSIHKVGAALQGAPSCNGWTFWHVEEGGSLMLIDALRQKHLSALG